MVQVPPLGFVIFCVFDAVWGSVVTDWRRHQKLSDNNVTTQRTLGNVFDLYKILNCATNCDPFALNNYGNFCGKGDRGGSPVDDIDSCCEQHDICYDANIEQYRCSSTDVYVKPYEGRCIYGVPICTDENKCGFWTCVCDKEFADCLNYAGCPKANK